MFPMLGKGIGFDQKVLDVIYADYSANISGYTLAFGALNFGTVAEKTVVTFDAFSVEITEKTIRIWRNRNE
jgi:hypothetical protein